MTEGPGPLIAPRTATENALLHLRHDCGTTEQHQKGELWLLI